MIRFDQRICRNLPAASSREWLETNGLRGYASSTIIGMNSRRYHGLLVAATLPPRWTRCWYRNLRRHCLLMVKRISYLGTDILARSNHKGMGTSRSSGWTHFPYSCLKVPIFG
jgi:hypothetical protein